MTDLNLAGQWFGSLVGTSGGFVVLDLDRRTDRYTGTALFMSPDNSLPHTAALIDTGSLETNQRFNAKIFPVHPIERRPLTPAELAESYPGVAHAAVAELTIKTDGENIIVSYATGISNAQGELSRFENGSDSTYKADEVCSWREFKGRVDEMRLSDLVWRGQPAPWCLKTSFHRTGRADLRRYVDEDIPHLVNQLLPYTDTFLELNSPLKTGALYNLAQHHGFPTPVLDWTFSPYVAAFFAFRSQRSSDTPPDKPARIFAFDYVSWPRKAADITRITLAEPIVTMLNLPPLENKRALPQQATAMFTNVSNVELFLQGEEQKNDIKYLYSLDLPWSERRKALDDLRTMGITAATMFPGIDGVCAEMADRLFTRD